MKYMIYGISLSAIAVLVVAAVMVFSGRNVRKNEMETALNAAVEQSLEQLKSQKGYEIKNRQELIADFNRILLVQVESDSELQVDILTADTEKGALDVKVTGSYQNILGLMETITCRKSVIIEAYTAEKPYYTVTFLVEGEVYHQYTACQGGTVVAPKNPNRGRKKFSCWTRQGESIACKLEELEIEGNIVLEAVFTG
ncbi:MAG: hypothetical protein HFH38_06000 [Lachnospiraceae bacterium]|jgi:hypothetical protein|nr:hypothetical protein [Lachnospiraceae bacterium]